MLPLPTGGFQTAFAPGRPSEKALQQMLERVAPAADKFHALVGASAQKTGDAGDVADAVHPDNRRHIGRFTDFRPFFPDAARDIGQPFARQAFRTGAEFKEKIPLGKFEGQAVELAQESGGFFADNIAAGGGLAATAAVSVCRLGCQPALRRVDIVFLSKRAMMFPFPLFRRPHSSGLISLTVFSTSPHHLGRFSHTSALMRRLSAK